jgi:hypothetical protein
VDGVVEGSDFNASWFLGGSQTNVVGAQQDVEEDGTFGAIYTLNSTIHSSVRLCYLKDF